MRNGTRTSQRCPLPALVLAGAVALLSLPARAATDMLTAAGASTAPTVSSCPTASTGTCSSGWFRIEGARTAVIKVNASAGTNTVLIEQRLDSSDSYVSTLKTLTDVGTTTVGYYIDPPAGDIRVTVSAVGGGGVVKAKLSAVTQSGGKLW